MKVIGLISGTSSDGVDAALVDIRSNRGAIALDLVAFDVYPYPRSLQKKLIDLASGSPQSVAALCHLNFYIGERFADAAVQIAGRARIPLSKIGLIGSHGQTVHHLPVPRREEKWLIRSTLQIGEPSVIAERTGVTTIADFRPRDMAAGGEGAPLTPYFHYLLLSDRRRSRAIINIGGISNVTYLKAGGKIEETLAFDMGPGNMLIDGLVSALTGARKRIDRQGKMARQGKISSALLSERMRHPFILKEPPKSTGREVFGRPLVGEILRRGEALGLPSNDLVATATAFTATAISENIHRFILKRGALDEVIVGGGGVHNPVLMAQLADALFPIPVRTFEAIGHQSRAIEAMTFALLAYQTFHGRPTNIPSVTGARHPVVLGKIVPGRSGFVKRESLNVKTE
ncbi:MAG TPA: anhydro-N-acetylmuramic acid kinase [Candidatus Manganitrophaceae bacterium]|nr:anhydro-N-acetylmuramic acid kinase [Candidatus Manganitrophaceae bacterium]